MTLRQYYLELLEKLIAIPSISAQAANLPEAAQLIVNSFSELAADITYDDQFFAPFILAKFDSSLPNAKTLVIYNHYDVQPAEPLSLWHSDPWQLLNKDGKLYGRGVNDDKGNLTARLTAIAEYLDENNQQLPVNIIFVIEGAEESASQYLENYLTQHVIDQESSLIIWESGGKNAQESLEIFGGNKGIVTFELSVTTAANDLHSSLAAVVDSAPIRLSRAIASLFDQKGNIAVPLFDEDVLLPNEREKSLVASLPITQDALIKQHDLKVSLYSDRNNTDFKESLYFKPTINVEGIISGYNGSGVKTVLPAQASAKLEARLVPNMSPDKTLQLITEHLTKQGFSDIVVKKTLGLSGYRSDMSDPEIVRVIDTVTDYYHKEPSVLPTSPGTGPMAIVQNIFQAPVASFGVGYSQTNDHAPNENIRLIDYYQHIDVIKALIDSYKTKIEK